MDKVIIVKELINIATAETDLVQGDINDLILKKELFEKKLTELKAVNEKKYAPILLRIQNKLKLYGIENIDAAGNNTAYTLWEKIEIIKISGYTIPVIYDDIGLGNPNDQAIKEALVYAAKNQIQVISTLNTENCENYKDETIETLELTTKNKLIHERISAKEFIESFIDML
ncbi:MAG: hypothetical protein HRT98_03400 [Mycoplasmatales bacterium]|nr:hypothetical protein [Mycoplasmatales bacterium]